MSNSSKVQDSTMTNPRAKVDDFFVNLALGTDIGLPALRQFFQHDMYNCGSSDDERTPKQVCARRRLVARGADPANRVSKKT